MGFRVLGFCREETGVYGYRSIRTTSAILEILISLVDADSFSIEVDEQCLSEFLIASFSIKS